MALRPHPRAPRTSSVRLPQSPRRPPASQDSWRRPSRCSSDTLRNGRPATMTGSAFNWYRTAPHRHPPLAFSIGIDSFTALGWVSHAKSVTGNDATLSENWANRARPAEISTYQSLAWRVATTEGREIPWNREISPHEERDLAQEVEVRARASAAESGTPASVSGGWMV